MDIFQANYGGGSPQQIDGKLSEASPTSSTDISIGTSLALSHRNSYSINPLIPIVSPLAAADDSHRVMLQQSKQPCPTTIFAAASNSNAIDDLHKLVHNYSSSQQSASIGHENHHHYNPTNAPNLLSHLAALQPQPEAVNVVPTSLPAPAYSDRLWEWNAISEASKDYTNLFK